jgi:hypothetical protein
MRGWKGAVLQGKGNLILNPHAAERLVGVLKVLRHLCRPGPGWSRADIRPEKADVSVDGRGDAVGHQPSKRQQEGGFARA